MTFPSFGGRWTEQKLEILRHYLDRYTTVLKNQPFTLHYVDGFAGAGSYNESANEYAEFYEFRHGSARIALEIDDKPFDKLVFIEKGADSAEALLTLANEFPGRWIEIIQGDANVKVPEFCRDMGNLDRAVVFLDPWATEASWTTVEAIANTKKIDCWILFPLSAVTRLMTVDREPPEAWANHLDRIFGGRKYWLESYEDSPQMTFFDEGPRRVRSWDSKQIAGRYMERLRAAFFRVADKSLTLRNSRNSPLFELFFAVGNPTGAAPAMRIADHILRDW